MVLNSKWRRKLQQIIEEICSRFQSTSSSTILHILPTERKRCPFISDIWHDRHPANTQRNELVFIFFLGKGFCATEDSNRRIVPSFCSHFQEVSACWKANLEHNVTNGHWKKQPPYKQKTVYNLSLPLELLCLSGPKFKSFEALIITENSHKTMYAGAILKIHTLLVN